MERNDALKAMVMALKEETMVMTMALNTRIEELERELALCRAAVGKGVPSAAFNCKDRMESYFSTKGVMDGVTKVNTTSMFLTNIKLLWCHLLRIK
ncbi:hypothetical protein Gogos_022301, partial [Gossypium gossypioides]|nr:hypothetical protein [Gossypium gossypioides]